MYAFAVFKKANYIFSIESVPAYVGGQIFLPFFEITIPNILCQWEQVRGCF